VGGVYWPNEPSLCVNAWLRGMIRLVVSPDIYAEYERVLRRVKAEQNFTTDLFPWLAALQTKSQWVAPFPLAQPVCRDPKDDMMIEAALAAGTKTIIARDADLTVLEKPFGIRILTPRAWLATLSRVDRRKLG
jgi:putative PIN family toxin of toxin-antitoxin system